MTWYDPPTLESYESLNFHDIDSKLNAKWKTAVIANNRAYIGNVKRQAKSTFNGGGSWSSTTTDDPQYQDLILKSVPFLYDKFPEGSHFEILAGDNDGDSIVKLETFADRLLVFKKYRLIIYNIQKGKEVIEAEYRDLGLDGGYPVQSFAFSFGVVWMNSTGVYLYDGKTIESLTDNKIRNMWVGEDDYIAFWKGGTNGENDIPAIAYDPKSKKIICIKTTTVNSGTSGAEDILVYSLKTKSWSYKVNALVDNTAKTFATYKGDLIFDQGEQVQTWNDVAAAGTGSGGNILYTKDYDFDSPGVRKKVHKVYITYQSGGSPTEVEVKYGVNGDTTPTETFSAGTNFGSSVTSELDAATGWQVATLKPSTAATANNIYSFRLAFTCNAAVPAGFEINDITIVYRVKPIK